MKVSLRAGMVLRAMPLILVMGVIFYCSHQPGDDIALPAIPDIDKLIHSLVYGILAGAALFFLPPATRLQRPGRTVLAVVLFCLAYGISDELHQLFITGREADLLDIVADTLGAVVVVGGWYVRAVSNRERRGKNISSSSLGSVN